jgi:HAD superfamily hydrolase (TIGR01509 family)
MTLRALIFDVDGTLADTEHAHLEAFNTAFEEAGLSWHWDVPLYRRLLEVSGGKERIVRYWNEVRGEVKSIEAHALEDTVQHLHDLKTAFYERMVNEGHVHLRPGVLALIEAGHAAGLSLAIATTTSPVNVSALLARAIGPDWRYKFHVVEDGSTAPSKKPHPQVYLQTLQRLGFDARECLAFEDSANGLKAARGAGLPVIVTPSEFTAHHDFKGAVCTLQSLEGVTIRDLRQWHANSLRQTSGATE